MEYESVINHATSISDRPNKYADGGNPYHANYNSEHQSLSWIEELDIDLDVNWELRNRFKPIT